MIHSREWSEVQNRFVNRTESTKDNVLIMLPKLKMNLAMSHGLASDSWTMMASYFLLWSAMDIVSFGHAVHAEIMQVMQIWNYVQIISNIEPYSRIFHGC